MIKKLKIFLENNNESLPYTLLSEYENIKWIKILKKASFSKKEIEMISELLDINVIDVKNEEDEYNCIKIKTGYIFSYNHDYYIMSVGNIELKKTRNFLCKGIDNLIKTIKTKLYNKQTVLNNKK